MTETIATKALALNQSSSNGMLSMRGPGTKDPSRFPRRRCMALLGAAVVPFLFGCSAAGDVSIENDNVTSAGAELKVATYTGGEFGLVSNSRWPATMQRNIRFCISSTGWPDAAFRNIIVTTYNAAAYQWSRTADVAFVHVTSEDGNCTSTNTNVDFNIVHFPSDDPTCARYEETGVCWIGHADAFYPNDARAQRVIEIGPQNFGPDVNHILQARHELGHALGFIHEGDAGGRALTAADPLSIMGSGSNITDLDREGSQELYGIPWENLGGSSSGAPAIASWGPDRLDIFVLSSATTNKRVKQLYYDQQWQSWVDLGAPPGGAISPPSSVARGPGRLDVFVQGADGGLWRKTYDSFIGGWQAWQSEGGVIQGRPGVTSWGTNRWDVLVVGGGRLYHKYFDGSSHEYENWGQPSGVTLTGAVAATSWGVDRLDAIVHGTNGGVYHFYYSSGQRRWTTLIAPGLGSVWAEPAIATSGVGELDVYLVQVQSGLLSRQLYRNGAWGDRHLKSSFMAAEGVGVVNWAPGRIDLVARRDSSSSVQLQHAYSLNNLWY